MKSLDKLKIEAILEKDKGMPYSAVLSTFNLVPRQFYLAVRDLETLVHEAKGDEKSALECIKEDKARRLELFRMEEEFLQEQYEKTRGMNGFRVQKSVAPGTYLHPENVEDIVYHALTLAHPKLLSQNREEIITEIGAFPKNLSDHLAGLGLGRLRAYPSRPVALHVITPHARCSIAR